MNKRIFAMLMALAMIISMVPMTALANDTACPHSLHSYHYTADYKYHNEYCYDCGLLLKENLAHEYVNDACRFCGVLLPYNPDEPDVDQPEVDTPADKPACNGFAVEWISNNDGTHQAICACGEHNEVQGCNYGATGMCYQCQYRPAAEPECDHEGGAWISNGDGTHTSKCECGEYVDGPHPCQEINGKCYMCGYEFHKCTMDELVSISETQHQFKCECGEFVGAPMNHYDNDGDNDCDGCGYTMYVLPECDHEGGAWISNGDGTHTSKCECGEYVDGPHPCYDLGSGKCYMCGYEFPVEEECNHEGGAWISNGDGTHTSKCECGEYVDGPHPCYDLGKGECYMCGYKFPVEEPECKHEWKGVVNNGVPGVHSIVCRDCLETLGAESHLFVDGRPCACGAIYVEETECKHEWKGVVNNGDATHNVVCRDCLEVLDTESHMFVDGRPCACGAIYIHDHDYEAGVTSNEDGTHNVNCSCGEFVAVACSDGNGDGKCDSCDYQMYPVHECDFEAGVTSNEDGTHNVNCSCGEFVTVDCLDNDGDDKCDSCGYQMYEHECEHDYKCVFYNEDIIKNVCKHCGDVEIESNAYYKLWQWCYDHGIKLGNNWWKYAGPWLNMFK